MRGGFSQSWTNLCAQERDQSQRREVSWTKPKEQEEQLVLLNSGSPLCRMDTALLPSCGAAGLELPRDLGCSGDATEAVTTRHSCPLFFGGAGRWEPMGGSSEV